VSELLVSAHLPTTLPRLTCRTETHYTDPPHRSKSNTQSRAWIPSRRKFINLSLMAPKLPHRKQLPVAPIAPFVPFRFMDLPTELRLLVYTQISPPVTAPIADYLGLTLVSKQIHDEFAPEAVKSMHAFLAGVKKDWYIAYGSEIHLTNPTSLTEIEVITVSIPLTFFASPKLQHGAFPNALRPLLRLDIKKLTIALYDDRPKAKPDAPPEPTDSATTTISTSKPCFTFFISGLRHHLGSTYGEYESRPEYKWEWVGADTFVFKWGIFQDELVGNQIIRDLHDAGGEKLWCYWGVSCGRSGGRWSKQTWTRKTWSSKK
jgi:hypothetical protein